MRPVAAMAGLLLVVAACRGASPSAVPSGAGLGSAPSATPAVVASSSQPSPSASAPDERPLQGLLPSDLHGTPAHTFAVGEEMLVALATAVEARREEVEVAFASDHGPAFVQMFAIRVPGHSAQELLDALPGAAFPQAAPETISVTAATLAGRDVTVISQPDDAARLGTFYALVDGGTLIVAQALVEPVAEAALAELPAAPSPGTYR